MSKSVKIEFTADFESIKVGDVKEFSLDISNIFIKDLKVAKLYEPETKTKKGK